MEKLEGKLLSTLAYQDPKEYFKNLGKQGVFTFVILKENNILPQDINAGSVFVVGDKLYF